MVIADSTTIEKSNLYSQAYANIYNLINTRTSVTDPIDSTGSRKFIYGRDPRVQGRGFKGYPFVIVNHVDVPFDNPSFNRKIKDTEFRITIEVWSSDDIVGRQDMGAQYLDSISDDVAETLNSNESTLAGYGLHNMRIESSPADTIEVVNNFIFTRTFTISFENRMLLS